MRKLLIVGCVAGLALVGACADTRQTRLDLDYGTSHKLAIFNQTYDAEAEKNLEPVTGLDSVAAEHSHKRYQNSFKREVQPTTYTINIGK